LTGAGDIDNDQLKKDIDQIMQDLIYVNQDFIFEQYGIPLNRRKDIRRFLILELEIIKTKIPENCKIKKAKDKKELVDLLVNFAEHVIGKEYVVKIANWNADFAQKLNPNKLAHATFQEKSWVVAVQQIMRKIKKNVLQGVVSDLEFIQDEIGHSNSERTIRRDMIEEYEFINDLLKKDMKLLPKNADKTAIDPETTQNILEDNIQIARKVLATFIVEKVNFSRLVDLDVDVLPIPGDKKEMLKSLKAINTELRKTDGFFPNYDECLKKYKAI